MKRMLKTIKWLVELFDYFAHLESQRYSKHTRHCKYRE